MLMNTERDLPKHLMVLTALLQGLCLFLLHQAIELEFWPHHSPRWLFAFYSFVFTFPTMLLLSIEKERVTQLLKWILPFSLVAAMLGYYTGSQVITSFRYDYSSLLAPLVLCISIGAFKVLMYAQQWGSGSNISYHGLFLWSWRNFLTLGLSLVFAGSVWAVLMLWGALFESLDISFFMDLFTERWFFYPAIALANGFGVIIFRSLTQVIDVIRRVQQALMKFLLVLLVFVSLLFLAALPLTGLSSLWESGGSTLILWMQALMLFFTNAVYQDEPDNRPYPIWIHRFLYIGLALLPIYSIISFYGLYIRVEQHGWSVSRGWGFLTWTILTLFAVGYLWGILKYKDNWLEQLSRVNVGMGIVVLAAVLLVSSPFMDFRKISVASQLARVENAELTLENLDIRYFHRHLAKPGHTALQKLKSEHETSDTHFAMRIDVLLKDNSEDSEAQLKARFLAALEQPGEPAPQPLIESILKSHVRYWSIDSVLAWYLVAIDADQDGKSEYLFVTKRKSDHTESKLSFSAAFYYLEKKDVWAYQSVNDNWGNEGATEAFFHALLSGDIEPKQPRWPDLQIGEQRLEIR